MVDWADMRSSEMSGCRKRLKRTIPFTPSPSSRATKFASEEKNGESLTAMGMRTACRTAATTSR